VLDPYALTLGFARRFTVYKRPNLLLYDPERLICLLTHPEWPVQLIVAGKAHPQDEEGKRLVQQFVRFASQPAVRHRVVFLEDYDMALAEHLVQGVDLWLNTPRRPWEACGTSGMKVLVDGGLNCSELDGWWAEAYRPEVGWALGDGREHPEPEWDAVEATQLYDLWTGRRPGTHRRRPGRAGFLAGDMVRADGATDAEAADGSQSNPSPGRDCVHFVRLFRALDHGWRHVPLGAVCPASGGRLAPCAFVAVALAAVGDGSLIRSARASWPSSAP